MRGIKIKSIGYYFWHGLVITISLLSIFEFFFEFLPIYEKIGNEAKIFFMSISFVGFFYEITNSLLTNYYKSNNLIKEIENGLIISRENRVDSAVLLEMESDLDSFFNTKSGSYHIIIVTNCLKYNEEPYIISIWKNINRNCRYLYVTPHDDQSFITLLINIFANKNLGDLSTVYQKVVSNVSHISDKHLFDILPDYFDLCLYCKDINYSISKENAKGFCCYQNELYTVNNRTWAFYYPMSKNVINKVYKLYFNEFEKEKILHPYISKKVEKKNSRIHGQGLFCKKTETIAKGDVVFIKGGYEVHRSEMSAVETIDSYLPIGDDLFLAAKTEEEEKYIKLHLNHSCAPNVGLLNERTFVAIRNIAPGEELTIDYAFVDNEEYSFECHCGSKNCRHTVTGHDWTIKEIQKKYYPYFSQYLKDKINSSNSKK